MNKAKRFFILSGMLAATCVLTGCSGINYTHGVSPATFLLPGLVNNEEPDVDPQCVSADAVPVLVAQTLR
jgi:hypothetical protein